MSRRKVADIREAVLLRQRQGLREELAKLSHGFAARLRMHAREDRAGWMREMDARNATRAAAVLRKLAQADEKLWRLREVGVA